VEAAADLGIGHWRRSGRGWRVNDHSPRALGHETCVVGDDVLNGGGWRLGGVDLQLGLFQHFVEESFGDCGKRWGEDW
jgi:hypothetical protein